MSNNLTQTPTIPISKDVIWELCQSVLLPESLMLYKTWRTVKEKIEKGGLRSTCYTDTETQLLPFTAIIWQRCLQPCLTSETPPWQEPYLSRSRLNRGTQQHSSLSLRWWQKRTKPEAGEAAGRQSSGPRIVPQQKGPDPVLISALDANTFLTSPGALT